MLLRTLGAVLILAQSRAAGSWMNVTKLTPGVAVRSVVDNTTSFVDFFLKYCESWLIYSVKIAVSFTACERQPRGGAVVSVRPLVDMARARYNLILLFVVVYTPLWVSGETLCYSCTVECDKSTKPAAERFFFKSFETWPEAEAAHAASASPADTASEPGSSSPLESHG